MIQDEFYALITTRTSPQMTEVYPVSIPQTAVYPAVSYMRISSVRNVNFSEVEDWVRTVFEVNCYAESFNEALNLAEDAKAALNGYRGGNIQLIRLDNELEMLEDAVDLYRVAQQYTVWHKEI
jgi:hypothetical protein